MPPVSIHSRCPHVMDICRLQNPPLIEIEPDHYAACHLHDQVVAATSLSHPEKEVE